MKKIFLLAAIAALSAGCQNSDIAERAGQMRFDALLPTATRVAGNAFESGDVMGVYVTRYSGTTPAPLQLSGNYANNAVTAYDGTSWVSTPAIYWTEDKYDVYAYYPYAKPASVDEYLFTVAADQRTAKEGDTPGGYEASDFLWAKATGVTQSATEGAVKLNFRHCMSRFVVNLKKGEQYEGNLPDDAVVRIHNTVPEAMIDLATGTVTRHPYESAKSITARSLGAGSYAAIVVPQRIEFRLPLVEIIAKGVSYLVESAFVFKPGVQYTYTITLNNDPDKVKIDIGGEIDGDWTE
ncbi:MAG: fimbrillin family protein [Prevotellaceae bacterium]|nr:fimbrillin family protein [Prevotellaceae bacterium]